MKALITKVTTGNMSVDVEVTYTRKNGFQENRVFSFPDEKLQSMIDEGTLEEFIINEGKRYLVIEDRQTMFNKLTGIEIRFDINGKI